MPIKLNPLSVVPDLKPNISQDVKSKYTKEFSQGLTLEGGKGGDLGEKSYPAKLFISEFDLNGQINDFSYGGVRHFDMHDIRRFQNIKPAEQVLNSTNPNVPEYAETDFKDNDCGYAIQCLQDANNKCTLNINSYSKVSSFDIYSKSSSFDYQNLYSGVVNSSTSISHNGSFGDFALKMAGTNPTAVTPVLDTDFNLNKYYINLKNGSFDVMLGKQLDISNLNNLFCFYVVELDCFDDYTSYLTTSISVDRFGYFLETNRIANFSNFKFGDTASISSERNIYSAVGKILNSNEGPRLRVNEGAEFGYDRNTYVTRKLYYLNSLYSVPSPSNNYWDRYYKLPAATFNINSPRFPNEIRTPTLKFCMFAKDFQDTYFNNPNIGVNNINSNKVTSYFNEPRDANQSFNDVGLNLRIDKRRTTVDSSTVIESSNVLYFDYDKFGIPASSANYDVMPVSINKRIERIRERDYIVEQYGTDANKLKIKNKPKFCLIFNGVIRTNNGFRYYCGFDNEVLSESNLNSLNIFNNINNPYLLIGNPTTQIVDNFNATDIRRYYSVKLYESLVYKNLNFNSVYNPIDVIKSSLFAKYKEKFFINAGIELSASDMYYSYVDRLNILGKMKKT